MLPDERLEEATKQIGLARQSGTLTQAEREWLDDAIRNCEAARLVLEESREQSEDAEVIE
jgi:hypothetical protein